MVPGWSIGCLTKDTILLLFQERDWTPMGFCGGDRPFVLSQIVGDFGDDQSQTLVQRSRLGTALLTVPDF